MNKVSILILTYEITFEDADSGTCYAGDGKRIISVHRDRAAADAIASKFNPILTEADKESIVWPMQKYNKILKNRFGFVCHDIDDSRNLKFEVVDYDLE
jgi:hypothetical protein